MPGDLVITGRDSAAVCLGKAVASETPLAWRDVLHAGPVQLSESLPALTSARAGFIAAQGWAHRLLSREELATRDRVLQASGAHERVWLWFGHDLADQLQLLQILDWFHEHRRAPETLILVEADDNLGELDPSKIIAFAERAREVSDLELELGAYAWNALRQPTPEAWAGLLDLDTSSLPYLRPAVLRMLDELPAPFTGMSRTEFQILRCIRGSTIDPRSLFLKYRSTEQVPFLEDWSFYAVLDRLATSPDPLLIGHAGLAFNPNMRLIEWQTYVRRRLKLTLLGQNVLAGQADCCDYNPIDRWWGGTHLTNLRLWRWSARGKRLLPPGARPDSSMAVELPRERVRRRPLKLAS